MVRALVWGGLGALALIPIALAAFSPLLAYRGAAYVTGGFAGIACLSVLLFQPLLAAGYLPGIDALRGRRVHRWTGCALLAGVALHVGGLYVTSPPDTIDALTLTAPTAFSVYGVVALWALVLAGLLVAARRVLRLGPLGWRRAHNALALLGVTATVAHAILIEGAMEPVSKWMLSGAALLAAFAVVVDLRILRPRRRSSRARTVGAHRI